MRLFLLACVIILHKILDGSIEGVPCPKRVEEVAEAYFEGIRAYYNIDE